MSLSYEPIGYGGSMSTQEQELKFFQEQQSKFFKEISKLKESNPTYKIHLVPDATRWYEESDLCGGEIVYVKLGKWLVDQNRIWLDESDLREHYKDYLLETEEGVQKMVDKMKPAILIGIAS